MARSVRDLRELICVSRLTYHESDDEVISDAESSSTCTGVENDFKELKLVSCHSSEFVERLSNERDSYVDTVKCDAISASPDSGFLTNTSPPSTSGSRKNSQVSSPVLEDTGVPQPSPPKSASKNRHRKKKRSRVPPKHELPKAAALPPVSSRSNEQVSSGNSLNDSAFCFDAMMTYIDATIITSWLQRANENVKELSRFCNFQDCFVQFAHFWLSSFPDSQKTAIYQMEYDILIDELSLAFAVGRQSGKVLRRDIVHLLGAIFKEYPAGLLSSKGNYIFLNYLDILSSDRTSEYKKLLSDVKCSTKNKQYAQWLLAARSFALVNVWAALLNFHRNLIGQHTVAGCLPLPSSVRLKNVHQQRMYQAVRSDFVDVVHYLIKEGHVKGIEIDNHERTWVFTAVMHNSPNVLSHLLKKVKPPINVNLPSDTGNTALHAACNQGNEQVTNILLQTPGIHVNCVNPQCDKATPLHLAVMHGHLSVVKALITAGADSNILMGDLSPVGMAEAFGQDEIFEYLKSLK